MPAGEKLSMLTVYNVKRLGSVNGEKSLEVSRPWLGAEMTNLVTKNSGKSGVRSIGISTLPHRFAEDQAGIKLKLMDLSKLEPMQGL